MEFLFRCRPVADKKLVPQLAAALEKRTELISRAKYPGMWSCTDRLEAVRKRYCPARRRCASLLLLGLSLFLLVPGLVRPRENLVPLIVGALGTAYALGELFRSRRRPQSRFEQAAEHLLAARGLIADDEVRVRFTETEVTLEEGQQARQMPYSGLQFVLETADTVVLTTQEQVLFLRKADLDGDIGEFLHFLQENVETYAKV